MSKYADAVNEIEQSLDDLQDFISSLDINDPANKYKISQAKKSYNVWSKELVRYKELASKE